jgi:hypothetical protein
LDSGTRRVEKYGEGDERWAEGRGRWLGTHWGQSCHVVLSQLMVDDNLYIVPNAAEQGIDLSAKHR